MELNPRDDSANSRLESARKFYVARLVRKKLKENKLSDVPIDYIPPIPQSEWKHPPASSALTEFFERWKNEKTQLQNTITTTQPTLHSSTSDTSNSLLSKKKKRATIVAIKRNIGGKEKINEELDLLLDSSQVDVQKFQFLSLDPNDQQIKPQKVRTSGDNAIVQFLSTSDPAEDVKSCTAFCCGQRVSLYPWLPGHSSRSGGPVTDCFGISYYPNLAIAALADGSSWGHTARQAAVKAVHGFIRELEANRKQIDNTDKVPQLLLNGLASAHNNILFATPGVREMGTSTLLGGILLPLQDQLGKWVFICASVGDCKAFHYSIRTRQIIEITAGNDRFKGIYILDFGTFSQVVQNLMKLKPK